MKITNIKTHIVGEVRNFLFVTVETDEGLTGVGEGGITWKELAMAGYVEALKPSHVVISPGPCTPNEAGVSLEAIGRLAGRMPILGVCLGHQAIGQAFGGKVVRARQVMHGKNSTVRHDGAGVFAGLPREFSATRYHSLVVERASLPGCLAVSAEAEDGEIMGLRHRELPVQGVQFHPEALLSEHGHAMLKNFLEGRLQ